MNEIEKGQLCQSTIEALYRTSGGLKHFPGLLKKIITTKAWGRRVTRGKVIELASLRELITSQPLDGWGLDPKRVESIIKDEPEVLELYYAAMQLGQGARTDLTNNISKVEGRNTKQGTGKAYTLTRLHRDHPELHAKVVAGEMSANAAAIAAGFRKKPTPFDIVKKNWTKLTEGERMLIIEGIEVEL